MANTEVVETNMVDRATVKEYCEEYCRENVDEQCREIIQDCKDEERIKFEELNESVLLWFKGLMVGIGLCWLYSNRRYFW